MCAQTHWPRLFAHDHGGPLGTGASTGAARAGRSALPVRSGVLTAAHLALLELLATAAVISLENAHLYRDIRERRPRSGGWSMQTSSASSPGMPTVASSRPTRSFFGSSGPAVKSWSRAVWRWTDFTLPEGRDREARVMGELKEGRADCGHLDPAMTLERDRRSRVIAIT